MHSAEHATPRGRDHYARITPSVDVAMMKRSKVVGIGGAYDLEVNLARCGLGALDHADFDTVEESNCVRQDFEFSDVGQAKTSALGKRVRGVNKEIHYTPWQRDVTQLSDSEADTLFEGASLVICATDDFRADIWTNEQVTKRQISCMFLSLYRGGVAGEVIYWVPGVTPACYRCIASSRYEHFKSGVSTKTPSDGGTIFDLRSIDAIAGAIALGILTRGSDTRYGRLIDSLGDRNLIQTRMDPDYRMAERDIFAERLGASPANFCWSTTCMPMGADDVCPDCGESAR